MLSNTDSILFLAGSSDEENAYSKSSAMQVMPTLKTIHI